LLGFLVFMDAMTVTKSSTVQLGKMQRLGETQITSMIDWFFCPRPHPICLWGIKADRSETPAERIFHNFGKAQDLSA